jgi:hypothetical protein
MLQDVTPLISIVSPALGITTTWKDQFWILGWSNGGVPALNDIIVFLMMIIVQMQL